MLQCDINSLSSWINIHENIPRKTKIISNYPPTQIPLHPPTNRSIATTILGETGCLSPYTYIYIYIFTCTTPRDLEDARTARFSRKYPVARERAAATSASFAEDASSPGTWKYRG